MSLSSTSTSAPISCADERRQAVVVAEADLVGGDGVVLVDDRQDAQPEQPLHRTLARWSGGVGFSRSPAVSSTWPATMPNGRRRLLVAVDEHVLADRRRGLLRGEIRGSGVELEEGHAGGDRAGGDEHDLGAAARAPLPGLDDRLDLRGVLAADRRRPHLHDDAARAARWVDREGSLVVLVHGAGALDALALELRRG